MYKSAPVRQISWSSVAKKEPASAPVKTVKPAVPRPSINNKIDNKKQAAKVKVQIPLLFLINYPFFILRFKEVSFV